MTAKRRNVKKKQGKVVPFERRQFPQEIIKRLERITQIAGQYPFRVFEDWVRLTEVTLAALPEQLKAVGNTGYLAEDPPPTAETFARVRATYEPERLGEDRTQRVWQNFAEAFALLLEATAPGLWGQTNSLNVAGISGPDIIGHILQTWANPPSGKSWHGQVLTPFSVASCMAQILNTDIERMVYDRVKEALCHPDNVLGAAVLLASLAIPEDDPQANFDWFLNRCVPAAGPHLAPILVQEPAVGTGVMILAHAAASPEWAVRSNIIRYRAQDIDPLMVACTRSSLMLYGINGYSLQLEAAVLEALQARQQHSENGHGVAAPSPAQAIQDVYGNGDSPPPEQDGAASFEQMFRAAAMSQPVAGPSGENLE